jgi:hypothetical protein
MPVLSLPKSASKLLKYLESCGGAEVSTFNDTEGKPDISAARSYAEAMRNLHKEYVDSVVSIEQKYNKVIVKPVP